VDEEDFQEEQNLVARLVHMLVNDDPEQMFQVRQASQFPGYITLQSQSETILTTILAEEEDKSLHDI
jgi:hypothetical protein